jgi:hypothetical protein
VAVLVAGGEGTDTDDDKDAGHMQGRMAVAKVAMSPSERSRVVWTSFGN